VKIKIKDLKKVIKETFSSISVQDDQNVDYSWEDNFNIYSDMYKELTGRRPRHISQENTSNEQLVVMLDELQSELEKVDLNSEEDEYFR
jgi:hypothetical protein